MVIAVPHVEMNCETATNAGLPSFPSKLFYFGIKIFQPLELSASCNLVATLATVTIMIRAGIGPYSRRGRFTLSLNPIASSGPTYLQVPLLTYHGYREDDSQAESIVE